MDFSGCVGVLGGGCECVSVIACVCISISVSDDCVPRSKFWVAIEIYDPNFQLSNILNFQTIFHVGHFQLQTILGLAPIFNFPIF